MIALKFGNQSFTISKAYVPPHFRMAGSNTRKVTETGSCKCETHVRIGPSGQIINKSKRKQMRKMANGRKYPVMCFRSQLVNVCPATRPCSFDTVQRFVGIFGQGGDHDFLTPIKIGMRRLWATIFGSSDRMGRNKLANPFSEDSARSGNDITLGAAAIGNDSLLPKIGPNTGKNFRHLSYRGSHQNQVRVTYFMCRINTGSIDNA